ncbi:BspA family leucine-rich repeat surface protein [Mycoplasmopsis agalactiae]|nr:DUF285 domain-containing protein [Mycoplasmopsis agalactiae]MCE6056420.1 BspA family leucine-rich repeat surface protein [Mycoplasmopsis agalactiae]
MKKKIKILTSLSLSLVSLPLIAASCKKRDGNKSEMTGAITEENTNPKNDPPLNNNDNMDNKNDSTTHSNSEQGDQANNGGTYTIPHAMVNTEEEAKRIQEEEAAKAKEEAERKQKEEEEKRKQEEVARKEKEAQEAKDKKDVETVKSIVKLHEDAFGSFHTQGEFVDQIALYAKDKNIINIVLQNPNDKDNKLEVDVQGGKNKIGLKLGTQNFTVTLGKVLKDQVLTKYYFEEEPNKILSNFSNNNIDKNWSPVNKKNKKLVVTQIGYFLQNGNIRATGLPHLTTKVPKDLPLKINSLYLTFHNLKSDKIDNLEKWNTKNLKTTSEAFYGVSEFNQDISGWNITDKNIIKGIFKNSSIKSGLKKKLASAWGTNEGHLSQ